MKKGQISMELGILTMVCLASATVCGLYFSQNAADSWYDAGEVSTDVRNGLYDASNNINFENVMVSGGISGDPSALICPYWIENTSSIWGKVNLSSGQNIFYILKSEGYFPNIDSVFIFADEFNGTELNMSKWGEYGTQLSYTVSDGNLNLVIAENSYIYSLSEMPTNYVYNLKFDNSEGDHDTRVYFNLEESNIVKVLLPWEGGDSRVDANDGSHYLIGLTPYSGTNNYVELKVSNDVLKKVTMNGNMLLSDLTVDRFGNRIGLGKDSDHTSKFDYLFIREYAETEPTVSTELIGDTLKVTIDSPVELTNYQVHIPASALLLTDVGESLIVTNSIN